jgi:hypothetical protein
MTQHRIFSAISMLILTASCSGDPNDPAKLMKDATSALKDRGMTVGEFGEFRTYPLSTRERRQVKCATVTYKESDCRVCLVTYADPDAAIAVIGVRSRASLPEGSAVWVIGKNILVVEPGERKSVGLVQDVYDELRALPERR